MEEISYKIITERGVSFSIGPNTWKIYLLRSQQRDLFQHLIYGRDFLYDHNKEESLLA